MKKALIFVLFFCLVILVDTEQATAQRRWRGNQPRDNLNLNVDFGGGRLWRNDPFFQGDPFWNPWNPWNDYYVSRPIVYRSRGTRGWYGPQQRVVIVRQPRLNRWNNHYRWNNYYRPPRRVIYR